MWTESQTDESINRASLHIAENIFSHGVNKCYIDGARKEQDPYTGQGWVYRKDGSTDTMIGTISIRRSLSPLYAKCWMWSFDMGDGMHEDPTNLRGGVSNWLLSIGEDGVYTDRMVGVHYTHGGVYEM